jgi:hypothetical protein
MLIASPLYFFFLNVSLMAPRICCNSVNFNIFLSLVYYISSYVIKIRDLTNYFIIHDYLRTEMAFIKKSLLLFWFKIGLF